MVFVWNPPGAFAGPYKELEKGDLKMDDYQEELLDRRASEADYPDEWDDATEL